MKRKAVRERRDTRYQKKEEKRKRDPFLEILIENNELRNC